jgi:hypothetical protein
MFRISVRRQIIGDEVDDVVVVAEVVVASRGVFIVGVRMSRRDGVTFVARRAASLFAPVAFVSSWLAGK